MFYCCFSFLFFLFSPRHLRAPSADRREILPRDRKVLTFDNLGLNILRALPKKLGPKHTKFGLTSVNFKLRSQISLEISKIGKTCDRHRFLPRSAKKVGWILVLQKVPEYNRATWRCLKRISTPWIVSSVGLTARAASRSALPYISRSCCRCRRCSVCWFIELKCVPNPCLNGGTCKENFPSNDYTCNCPQKHTGVDCQSGELALFALLYMPEHAFLFHRRYHHFVYHALRSALIL